MKKNLLLKLSAVFFMLSISFMNAQAQTVTCYDATESSANDFWLTHFYFAKCTDYIGTGSKDVTDPLWNAYIDFNGGSSVDFTKIRVASDGTYIVRLSYGIGYAEPVVGASFDLVVNDEFVSTQVVQAWDDRTPDAPRTIDLEVTLAADWDNVIKIQQKKDWPTILGMQLMKKAPVNGSVVTCYDASESSTNDFWFNHFYYAKCTDFVGTGSKEIADPAWSAYIDFNGGSSVDFTKIRVANDGTYTARLFYGIGWAEPVIGANFNLLVNDEFVSNNTVHTWEGRLPEEPRTLDLPVTLAADWDNVIKIQQNKDWPTILGIQLIKNSTAVNKIEKKSFNVFSLNKTIQVTGLTEKNNRIEIYSITGKLLYSGISQQGTYSKSINHAGLYLVRVKGITSKVVVE